MSRRVQIKAEYRKEPDLGLYVLALIELARQLQEEETRHSQVPSDGAEAGAQS